MRRVFVELPADLGASLTLAAAMRTRRASVTRLGDGPHSTNTHLALECQELRRFRRRASVRCLGGGSGAAGTVPEETRGYDPRCRDPDRVRGDLHAGPRVRAAARTVRRVGIQPRLLPREIDRRRRRDGLGRDLPAAGDGGDPRGDRRPAHRPLDSGARANWIEVWGSGEQPFASSALSIALDDLRGRQLGVSARPSTAAAVGIASGPTRRTRATTRARTRPSWPAMTPTPLPTASPRSSSAPAGTRSPTKSRSSNASSPTCRRAPRSSRTRRARTGHETRSDGTRTRTPRLRLVRGPAVRVAGLCRLRIAAVGPRHRHRGRRGDVLADADRGAAGARVLRHHPARRGDLRRDRRGPVLRRSRPVVGRHHRPAHVGRGDRHRGWTPAHLAPRRRRACRSRRAAPRGRHRREPVAHATSCRTAGGWTAGSRFPTVPGSGSRWTRLSSAVMLATSDGWWRRR